ncbi:hypothetical protein B0H14DRAFT_2833815, partial [Mycena olivaceomarginata]
RILVKYDDRPPSKLLPGFPLGLLPHGFLAARGTLFASRPEAVASHCLKWFIIDLSLFLFPLFSGLLTILCVGNQW